MARRAFFSGKFHSQVSELADRCACTPQRVSPWQIPLDRDLAAYLGSVGSCPAAYVPRHWELVPEPARGALCELISIDRPRDVAVSPSGIRHVGGAQVYCPMQVLGAGEHGVALWIDDLPFDRVTAALAYRDIRMVQHSTNSESGHLTVIGAARRFTFHYRRPSQPSCEPQLEGLSLRIRLRAAGLSEGAAHYGDLEGWRAVQSIDESAWPAWRTRARSTRTAILTDHELVLIEKSAAQFGYRHGEDVLAVPCQHLQRISAAGNRLIVDAEAISSVPLGAVFARRVAKRISKQLRESISPADYFTTNRAQPAPFQDTTRQRDHRAPRGFTQGGMQ
jgi:hypothetical protein